MVLEWVVLIFIYSDRGARPMAGGGPRLRIKPAMTIDVDC